VHEIGGHAAVAALLGCRLERLRLFLFGGGWVDFACPAPLPRAAALAIDLGGIALEVGVGVLLVVLARGRRGFAAFCASAAGTLFVLHALFYLVTGTHAGAGDGRTLHRLLGPSAVRVGLVVGASALLVAATFAAAARLARRIAVWSDAASWSARAALIGSVALAAAAAHGALLRVEQHLRPDPVYAKTFEPEHARALARARERVAGAAGERAAEPPAPPSEPSEVASETREAGSGASESEAHREPFGARFARFPLTPLLGAAMTVAAAAGVVLASRQAPPAAGRIPLARAVVACVVALGLVLALDVAL
jgi:hypothetical protein